MNKIRAVIIAGGVTVYDATPSMNTGNWSTAAVGGFASCELTLPGVKTHQIPYLARLRVLAGPEILFEGEIEDRTLTIDDSTATTIQAFGLRRRLDDTSIRRIWIKRDLDYQDPITIGNTTALTAAANALAYHQNDWQVSTGQFDPSDLTRIGIAFVGGAVAARTSAAAKIVVLPTAGMVGLLTFDADTNNTANDVGGIRESADGVTWTEVWSAKNTAKTSYFAPIQGTTRFLQFIGQFDTGALNTNALITIENIRLNGSSLAHGANGNLWGSDVLLDILDFVGVPGIQAGIIEDGSDFEIQAIDRADRDTVTSVVTEVAGYYTREWAVWEDGRFDWRTVNFDEAQYQLAVADCMKIELEGTVEDTPRTVYVQYQDVTGFNSEASAVSTDQRNPFVRQSRTKDEIVQVSFPMTNVTAQQLAARIAADHGAYPSANGQIVLAFNRQIQRANGSPAPAYMLRGGENVTIRDLPKTDAFQVGRDGETHFHIASVEADMEAQTVTLEIEGQIRRSDVLLARLASATKTLTG